MEADLHSPECPDVTDLMRGLIQELSSLKSGNLFFVSSLYLYSLEFLTSLSITRPPHSPVLNLGFAS